MNYYNKHFIDSRIILIGDESGVKQLLKFVPNQLVVAIIAASNRPQYHSMLKKLAAELAVPLLIQASYNTASYNHFRTELKKLCPDLLLCNSYSMLIRQDILRQVDYNAINVHAALLPKNRGPNPIQWAIIKGEKYTGVTLHYMSETIDTGDIIMQDKIPIMANDTWVTLYAKLQVLTEQLLEVYLPKILYGDVERILQDDSIATTNSRLNENSPAIDFDEMDDTQVYNLIRAQVKPLKGAYIESNGLRLHFDELLTYNEVYELRNKITK